MIPFRCQIPFISSVLIYAEETGVWGFVAVIAVTRWCAGKYVKLRFLPFALG